MELYLWANNELIFIGRDMLRHLFRMCGSCYVNVNWKRQILYATGFDEGECVFGK